MYATLSFLFFASGITGLVYQVLWARYLSIILGNSGIAHAVVLAVFLGGLALGNAIIGAYADRVKRPLALYGWLELAVAVFALISPTLLGWVYQKYPVFVQADWSPAMVTGVRVLISSVILLLPTICMGGTLPAMTRHFTARVSELESRLSWLYFLNSLGAACGAFLCGFLMIPGLGLDLAVTVTVIANIVIGVISLGLSRKCEAERDAVEEQAQLDSEEMSQEHQLSIWGARIILFVVFASGFISLAYEVAWIRLLAMVLGSSTYSFSLMLSAFITGIALGSLAVSANSRRKNNPLVLLALAEVGIAASLLVTFPLYERLPHIFLWIRSALGRTDAAYLFYLSAKFLFCFAILLLPTFFLGATLPLAARAVTRASNEIGKMVGRVYSWNTLGNVLGALSAGLFLLPLLGVEHILLFGALLNTVLALMIFPLAGIAFRSRATFFSIFVVIGLIFLLSFGGRWDLRVMISAPFMRQIPKPFPSFKNFKRGFELQKVLLYRDDVSGTVSVTEYETGTRVLKVNGKADASTGVDMSTQVLLGHLPLLMHEDPKEVMIVGLGSGITAGAALRYPINHLDVAEISPGVKEAARHFSRFHGDAFADKRMSVHIEDARAFLQTRKRKYDVIISEPSNPWVAGVGNLFTREFYRELYPRLNKGGIVAQWFHTYAMDDQIMLIILRTFAEAFPHVSVWRTLSTSGNLGDFVLIGSLDPPHVNFDRLRERISIPSVQSQLKALGLQSVSGMLSLQVLSEGRLRALVEASSGPVNQDRFPVLEYQAPRLLFSEKSASLIDRLDERLQPTSKSATYLTEFLRQRNRELSLAEFQEFANFYGVYGGAKLAKHLAQVWTEAYPESVQARMAAAAILHRHKDYQGALSHLEKLLGSDQAKPEHARFAADVAFDALSKEGVYFGATDMADRIRGYISMERDLGGGQRSFLVKTARVAAYIGEKGAAAILLEKALEEPPVGDEKKSFSDEAVRALIVGISE